MGVLWFIFRPNEIVAELYIVIFSVIVYIGKWLTYKFGIVTWKKECLLGSRYVHFWFSFI